MSAIYDKTGREIMHGDVLKVFHFVGRRNKHHFMYKQVVGERLLGRNNNPYWVVSHLNQRDDGTYLLAKDGAAYDDYEIVQSIDACFEDRPRKRGSAAAVGSANLTRDACPTAAEDAECPDCPNYAGKCPTCHRPRPRPDQIASTR